MKKVLILLLTLIFFGAIQSCKKGENDPLISLRSRDSRITGNWILVNAETNSNIDGDISSATYTNSIMTETSNDNSSSYSYSINWDVKSDGTINSSETINGYLSTSMLTWYWLDDNQKKTKIFISGGEGIYVVDRLTNKELVLKYQYEYSNPSGNDLEIYSSTITFEKD